MKTFCALSATALLAVAIFAAKSPEAPTPSVAVTQAAAPAERHVTASELQELARQLNARIDSEGCRCPKPQKGKLLPTTPVRQSTKVVTAGHWEKRMIQGAARWVWFADSTKKAPAINYKPSYSGGNCADGKCGRRGLFGGR